VREPMRTITVANHKGGVGKTTTVANLAPALAELGRRVVMVDLDPQANLTEAFGLDEEPGLRIEDLLSAPQTDPTKAIVPVGTRLGLIRASEELADLAWELPRVEGYEWRLRDVLAKLVPTYDFALIDTPPGVGIWPGMALLASDGAIVPAQPADHDVGGAGKFYDYVEEVIRPDNPNLELFGVLLTRTDRRWRLRREAQDRLRLDEMHAFEIEIPESVRVKAAPRFRQPSFLLEPDGRVAFAYRALATELLERVSHHKEVAA
jgi:chromosome partitioning protein